MTAHTKCEQCGRWVQAFSPTPHVCKPESNLEKEKCGNCHVCLAGVVENGMPVIASRMIVCTNCGNKRCPKATNHRNDCTGSNEPGQPGSIYKGTAKTPLPEDEILQIYRSWLIMSNNPVLFVRAIEERHGIK